MRFTDNPLEILMRQRPYRGREEAPPKPILPPFCQGCLCRNTLCDYGICWQGSPERGNDAPDEDKTE